MAGWALLSCRGGAAPLSFFLVPDSGHALGWTAPPQPAIDERVQISIHHRLDIARLHAGAQILHHPVGLKDVTADLIAPGDAALLAIKPFHLLLLRIHSLRVNAGQKQLHRRGPVLVLGTLAL